MTLALPFAETNAIEAVAFALVFAREFEDREVEALLSLEQSLKDLLPSFQKANAVSMNIVEDKLTEQTQKMSGVVMQSFQSTGKQDWILRASENRIVVNCLKYGSWSGEWPKARHMLLKAAQCVDSETNGVINVGLQVVDKFVYSEDPTNYSIEDIFNQNSEFLTPHVKKSGKMWHVFQGWFEALPATVDETQKILHVAKLSSAYINEKLVATIDHTMQTSYSKPLGVKFFVGPQNIESGSEFLNTLYKQLHDKNADLLRNILAKAQLDAIGLSR